MSKKIDWRARDTGAGNHRGGAWDGDPTNIEVPLGSTRESTQGEAVAAVAGGGAVVCPSLKKSGLKALAEGWRLVGSVMF